MAPVEQHKNSAEQRILELARAALNDEVDLLNASYKIVALATGVGLGLTEPFISLSGIVSQLDHIPAPSQLAQYEPSYFARLMHEREDALAFFRDDILRGCADVVARGGKADAAG